MTRILVADPNTAGRKALALLITRKLGIMDIYEAEDTETLIRTLANCPPDILLLDWRLYGAPAPETCRLLRKAYPWLKVILLSVEAEDEQAAQGAGATFIYKGTNPIEVLAILESILKINK